MTTQTPINSKMDTTDWTVDDHIEYIRHHAKVVAVMSRLYLNTKFASMVYYDLPWMRDSYEMSPELDPLAVQEALLDLGPNPVLQRAGERKGRCKCGGAGDSHFLSCSIWPHNNKEN